MRRIWSGESADVMSHVRGELWVAWGALACVCAVRGARRRGARLWMRWGSLLVVVVGGPYGTRAPGRTARVWTGQTRTFFARPSLRGMITGVVGGWKTWQDCSYNLGSISRLGRTFRSLSPGETEIEVRGAGVEGGVEPGGMAALALLAWVSSRAITRTLHM